ncbi:MAG: DUF420 domain-containing protein [Cytophagales bacterium]
MSNLVIEKSDTLTKVIWGISIAIPIVVGLLLMIPGGVLGDLNVSFLPHLNGILNTLTSLALILGFYFIKFKKDREAHRKAMSTAFILSSVFLVSYVVYHLQTEPTKFPDNDLRIIYLFLLFSHILLAAIVVPLVLFSIYFALTKQFERHVKLVKYTFPIWLYVAVTGVVVYLMISPYYVA